MPSSFDGLTRRSRKISGGRQSYVDGRQFADTGQTWTNKSGALVEGGQVTLSEGHPWPPRSRSLEDIGGPFKTTRWYVTDSPNGKPLAWDDFPWRVARSASWDKRSPSGNYYSAWALKAPFIPVSPATLRNYAPDRFVDPSSSEEKLLALGATAISRCKPTNPAADLSVALGELFKEGLPKAPGVSTWQNRTAIAKGAGSEYLNSVFGWQPLISEVEAVVKAASRQEAIWRQYRRDAGKVVRRSYRFPTEKTTSTTNVSNVDPYPVPVAYIGKKLGRCRRTRTVTRDVWFSGAFTYYLPKAEGEGSLGKWFNALQKAKAVYGLTLDPEVVWNLTPWSWAADWFANTGDVISNISDTITDGLVMHYGYVMEHVVVRDEFSLTGYEPHQGSDLSDLKCYFVHETKQRLRASPYGFGLTWDSFSPKQLAILAALGISR